MAKLLQQFKQNFSIIGQMYRMARKNKRLWWWNLVAGVLLVIMYNVFANIIGATLKFDFVGGLGGSYFAHKASFLRFGIYYAVLNTLIYLILLILFFYASHLWDKDKKNIIYCLREGFFKLGSPFFWFLVVVTTLRSLFFANMVIRILFALLLLPLQVLANPIIAYGSGSITSGLFDLFYLLKRFWVLLLTFHGFVRIFSAILPAILWSPPSLPVGIASILKLVVAIVGLAFVLIFVIFILAMDLFLQVYIAKEAVKTNRQLFK